MDLTKIVKESKAKKEVDVIKDYKEDVDMLLIAK